MKLQVYSDKQQYEINMIIKFLAGIVTFSLLSAFFSSDDMTLLAKGVTKSETVDDNLRFKVVLVCKACDPILKDAIGATLSCGEEMLENEPEDTVSMDRSPPQNLKSDGKEPLITSDHKTNCEYINLFGKQIGDVPQA